MANVFISYRNTPERRQIVRRLALFLQVHGISAWWDHGLEAGSEFENRIKGEIERADFVMPLWCFESVFGSPWVLQEARWGSTKLFPVRLQNVAVPRSYSHLHSANLIAWDGRMNGVVTDHIIAPIAKVVTGSMSLMNELKDELALLPKFEPLPCHSQEHEGLLRELKSSYIQLADMPTIEEIQRISFDTLLSELSLPNSDDVGECVYDILQVRYMLDDLEPGAIEEFEIDDVTTVGHLIEFLFRRRRHNASPVEL